MSGRLCECKFEGLPCSCEQCAAEAFEAALAAGSQRAETNEDLAQCEASQSGPNGATPKTSDHPTTERE